MKTNRLTVLATACICSAMTAQGLQWNIEGNICTVDTLYHATIGPGTTETELRLTSKDANAIHNIYYTATDLSNRYVEMRAAKAGNHMRMLDVVPSIARQMSGPSEDYFAGVNADFFNMGHPYNPIGLCIANGFLTNYEADGADIDPYYIVFDAAGTPDIVRHITKDWYGLATMPDGSTYNFTLNTGRGENELLLYTPQWQYYNPYEGVMCEQGRTGTNRYGVEVALKPIGQNVLFGSSLTLEVISSPEEGIGNMPIPAEGYVLSGHGDARPQLRQLKKGDRVSLKIGFAADGKATAAKEVLGGYPTILDNGIKTPTLYIPDHLPKREPRTAVGYNSDKSTLYMLVADGRNAGGSTGLTQRELADVMKNIGCFTAMNFDGGGSSTMFVKSFGVKNVPSVSSLDNRDEGQPRTVVNALFAVATSPVDNVIASIELRDKNVRLTPSQSYTPVVYGYNQYGVLVSTDVSGCSFTLSPEVGTVNGSVITAAEKGNAAGKLTATYQNSSYTVPAALLGDSASTNDITADSDDTEPEYYRLDGVRIDKPVPGSINVVRRGYRATLRLNTTH